MLINASNELVALCRTQISLISSLGCSFSVVYLTTQLSDSHSENHSDQQQPQLIPLVAMPETAEFNSKLITLSAPEEVNTVSYLLPAADASTVVTPGHLSSSNFPDIDPLNPPGEDWQHSVPNEAWGKTWEIVLPFLHEGKMIGLLVTGRNDRPWQAQEYDQIQKISESMAIACVIDQRSRWLEEQLRSQQLLQEAQYDTIHALLHQFKSPVTALKTFGKLLLKRILPGDKNRDFADSVVRESDRLKELLVQLDQVIEGDVGLLDIVPNQVIPNQVIPNQVNRLNQPQLTASNNQPTFLPLLTGSNMQEAILLQPILEAVITSAWAIAQEQQVNLYHVLPADLPSVIGHSPALREVFTNLIDNAVKYTPSNGYVYITAKIMSEKNLLIIGVSDTGYGIPSEDLPHLFTKYYRGAKAQTDIPGTGLGLAIARSLLQQMAGDLQIFSPVLEEWLSPAIVQLHITNPGTTVLVSLPLAK
jgi:signal transduction histidine kinase